jgi:hypothetical protein
VVGKHRHACGDGSIGSRRGREVGSDESRENDGAVAGGLRGAERPRHPDGAQRLLLLTIRISTPTPSPSLAGFRSTETTSWGGGSATMSWDWRSSAIWSSSSPVDQWRRDRADINRTANEPVPRSIAPLTRSHPARIEHPG